MRRALPLLTALLLAPLAALHAADGAPQGKPNIVFFLIDDCSTHEFGCYGNKVNPTPNIDRLAASGTNTTAKSAVSFFLDANTALWYPSRLA